MVAASPPMTAHGWAQLVLHFTVPPVPVTYTFPATS